jgi:hypothetical protein
LCEVEVHGKPAPTQLPPGEQKIGKWNRLHLFFCIPFQYLFVVVESILYAEQWFSHAEINVGPIFLIAFAYNTYNL